MFEFWWKWALTSTTGDDKSLKTMLASEKGELRNTVQPRAVLELSLKIRGLWRREKECVWETRAPAWPLKRCFTSLSSHLCWGPVMVLWPLYWHSSNLTTPSVPCKQSSFWMLCLISWWVEYSKYCTIRGEKWPSPQRKHFIKQIKMFAWKLLRGSGKHIKGTN